MKPVRRIELVFDDQQALQGAQATFADGTSAGLDTGKESFYSDKLAEVAGQGLSQALTSSAAQKREIARLSEELEGKDKARQAAEGRERDTAGEVADLKAELADMRGRLADAQRQLLDMQSELLGTRERLARKSDELQTLTVKMLAGAQA
jgi:chromosome segregation ATPase